MQYKPRAANINFDRVYGGLFETYRTNLPGFLQYFSVYLVRKQAYAHIVFYLNEEQAILQVYLNLMINFFFVLYLVAVQPFKTKRVYLINFMNEIIFYIISCFFLGFTNINFFPESKIIIGWVIIALAILNLIFPNAHSLLKECLPEW